MRTLDNLLMPIGFTLFEGGHESVAPDVGKGSLHAVATAEVYFQRPAPRADGREEFPSLFNPYWQSRLVPTERTERQITAASRGLTVDPFAVLP